MKRAIIIFALLCFCSALFLGVLECHKKPTPPTTEPYYIGNKNTKIFHRPSCSYLPAPENQVRFNTRQEAINAGYTPCGHCKP